MSVFKNFKNIHWSPYRGRQGLNVIFFLQICNKVPDRGRAGAGGRSPPPTGDRGAYRPPRGRPGAPLTGAAGGACRPPSYINIVPPFPPHLSLKIPAKFQKKREG